MFFNTYRRTKTFCWVLQMVEYRVLELFSGIGGMHYALQYAQLPANVVAAMDINTVANAVYAYNHKNTKVCNNNIQSLTPEHINKLNVNMLLMSPPCQPHTRQGLQKDLSDRRSDAFRHICELLPACIGLQYVLMENVKGFEDSLAHTHFIEALSSAGFHYRELILTPTQYGVPNTRHRYYCLARKANNFDFDGSRICIQWPTNATQDKLQPTCAKVEEYLDVADDKLELYLLRDEVLGKRVWLLDLVTGSDCNTMCFTKGYTHYIEGTGSVYTPLTKKQTDNIFAAVKAIELSDEADVPEKIAKRISILRSLRLRFFTPREVAKLMCFPEDFCFPPETTNRQKYRLLGNSINVQVVGELLKLLINVH